MNAIMKNKIELACAGLRKLNSTGDGMTDTELLAAIYCLEIVEPIIWAMKMHPASGYVSQQLNSYRSHAKARRIK